MSQSVEVSDRQLIPLSLLEAADGEISGRTRLQKLAFLMVEEELGDDYPGYEFEKHNYGPFSKTLLQDIERLDHDGVVDEDETRTFSGNRRHDYEMDSDFLGSISDLVDSDDERAREALEAARKIVEEHNDKPIRSLVEDVYDEHPKYLENSVYER